MEAQNLLKQPPWREYLAARGSFDGQKRNLSWVGDALHAQRAAPRRPWSFQSCVALTNESRAQKVHDVVQVGLMPLCACLSV